MAQDEESPEHGALHEPIERPKQPWMHVSEEMSRRSQKRNDGDVTQEISNGAQRVFLPAFLGDSRTDLGQGESRRLEEGRGHLLLVCATIAASIFFFFTVESVSSASISVREDGGRSHGGKEEGRRA